MAKIQISENDLKQIVAESVKKILSEARKPSDKTVGKHTLKGLRYDKNGNPLYTSDTMSDDEKKNQGWKFSKKHGMYGQLSDPTKLSESKLKQIVAESVKKILKENMSQQYSIDLKISSLTNQQSMSRLHSLIKSGKPTECVLNMFYGNGFTCDVTFSTNGNSVCTMTVTSSTQYNKTFEYPAGSAVQQALNIGRNLCNQWLQSIKQNRQQTM